ncbi:alpha/beta hydrolase [Antrihabitans cavernicola]|uniref:Esterase family protein n=1 Tax=Antrihabitans cavernicola TaxID=2495913 RepID=A0A5A7SCB8_9NOCA|nr:esterase family protein [Spelaeibacter cavernicola]
MLRASPFAGSARARAMLVGVIAASAISLVSVPAVATADPAPAQSAGSHLVSAKKTAAQRMTVVVHSAAMDKDITLDVLRPADTSVPRPTLYLLSGVEGASDIYGWANNTDVVQYFADKNVNVVIPWGGASSYYSDWKNDDPTLGRNKWSTFLTRELPPVLNSSLGATGVNALAGMSMSGTSALNLAIAAPGLYKAVGAFSGCAMTSDPLGAAYVATTVADFYGNPINMWGLPTDPTWIANDPYRNAEKLRGTQLYLSNGTGLPGKHDTLNSPWINSDPAALATTVLKGGTLEAATGVCAHQMADRLAQLQIPATVNFHPGTHSWGYWQDDLSNFWPMAAAAIGA